MFNMRCPAGTGRPAHQGRGATSGQECSASSLPRPPGKAGCGCSICQAYARG
jgi:hypothetical protein